MNPEPEAKQVTVAGQNDGFNLFNQKEIADTVSSISKIITLMLGGGGHFAAGRGAMSTVSMWIIEFIDFIE